MLRRRLSPGNRFLQVILAACVLAASWPNSGPVCPCGVFACSLGWAGHSGSDGSAEVSLASHPCSCCPPKAEAESRSGCCSQAEPIDPQTSAIAYEDQRQCSCPKFIPNRPDPVAPTTLDGVVKASDLLVTTVVGLVSTLGSIGNDREPQRWASPSRTPPSNLVISLSRLTC